MNQALYRKYRPKNFSEVLGQDEVIKVLTGEIKKGSISHAYLFSGTRGTGKTSVARIFAKEVGVSDTDIYEIDAASNRGIDEVRELREAVHTLPYESPYKVYIIDEVHMLTTPAFNALLKTLEEPPEHVIFIMATTEKEKLPDTVISRCETLSFKKPTLPILKTLIRKIAKEEGFKIDESSDDLIALLGDGSFRDAIGVLQKVIGSIDGKEIELSDVEDITGAPRSEAVNTYIRGLAGEDTEKALKTIRELSKGGNDMNFFLTLVLEKVRAALLLRINSSSIENELKEEFKDSDIKFLKEIAGQGSINSSTLISLLESRKQMNYARMKHIPLELILLEALDNG